LRQRASDTTEAIASFDHSAFSLRGRAAGRPAEFSDCEYMEFAAILFFSERLTKSTGTSHLTATKSLPISTIEVRTI
jgi:hypothetical protein